MLDLKSINEFTIIPAVMSTVNSRKECNPYYEDGMLPLFTAPMASTINEDNYKEIIDSIVKVGFKNVFIEWYNDDFELQQNILNYVESVGLNIIFAHLGYQRPHVIWNEGDEGDIEIERYMNDIVICKNNGIDLVIIHPTFQYEKQDLSEVGINRIKRLI